MRSLWGVLLLETLFLMRAGEGAHAVGADPVFKGGVNMQSGDLEFFR